MSRFSKLSIIALTCALLPIVSPVSAINGPADWQMGGHDAQRTGRSPFSGPNYPNIKWKYDTGNYVYSSPVFASGGGLLALNPDGNHKWETYLGASVNGPPAIGSDGTIYYGSFDNYL